MKNKTYLQFRRALRRYYQHETPGAKKMTLSRNGFWRRQYNDWASGYRGVGISDATFNAMTS